MNTRRNSLYIFWNHSSHTRGSCNYKRECYQCNVKSKEFGAFGERTAKEDLKFYTSAKLPLPPLLHNELRQVNGK